MSCLLTMQIAQIRLNFSFRFLYNFTGQLKNIKLVILMIESFDKYHNLFNLHILVTILFFDIEIQAY